MNIFLLLCCRFVSSTCYLNYSRISLILSWVLEGSAQEKIPPFLSGAFGVSNFVLPTNFTIAFSFGLLDSVRAIMSTIFSSIMWFSFFALATLSLSILLY